MENVENEAPPGAAPTLPAPGPLKWTTRATSSGPPGTQPPITSQGSLPTCTTHSLAKCIQAWFDKKGCKSDCLENCEKHGFDVTFEHVYKKLIAIHGECAKYPWDFHNTEVTVEVTTKGFQNVSKKTITVKIEVQTYKTRNYHWEDSNNPIVSSPRHFTAIGCLETPLGNHAVYIKSYNPQNKEVDTINSHGPNGELGPLYDTNTLIKGGRYDFYQVDLIRLTNVQAANHQPMDQKDHDVTDSGLPSAEEEKKISRS